MKKLITFVFLFVTAHSLFSQKDTSEYYNPKAANKFSVDKVHASIAVGAGVASNNSSYTFVAPKIGYQVTSKFRLNVGLIHYSINGNSLIPLTYNEGFYNNQNRTVNGNLVFVEGQYLVKPRLIVSGAVMTNVSGFSQQNNYRTASLGLEYKVSEYSSIKFQTTISQGQGNYYNNPSVFPANGFNSFGTGFSSGNSMFR